MRKKAIKLRFSKLFHIRLCAVLFNCVSNAISYYRCVAYSL